MWSEALESITHKKLTIWESKHELHTTLKSTSLPAKLAEAIIKDEEGADPSLG